MKLHIGTKYISKKARKEDLESGLTPIEGINFYLTDDEEDDDIHKILTVEFHVTRDSFQKVLDVSIRDNVEVICICGDIELIDAIGLGKYLSSFGKELLKNQRHHEIKNKIEDE